MPKQIKEVIVLLSMACLALGITELNYTNHFATPVHDEGSCRAGPAFAATAMYMTQGQRRGFNYDLSV